MSNKVEKSRLAPKRRFPEFQETGAWSNKPMREVYSFKGTNSLPRDKLNYERGSTKNIHYGDVHTKFSTLFDITKEVVPYVNECESQDSFKAENYCVEGDMIFADASEDLDDIGKSIEIVKLNGQRVVAGLHTILARQSAAWLVIGFGGYLFKSHAIRKQIQKESQGAKVLGISGGRLAKIMISFPSSKTEQQKIADCLTALDELISLEAQKLGTLKTHKKGLMQQLFPTESETVPKLRFPQFLDAGEWMEKSIADFGDVVTGSTPSTARSEFYGGTFPFVSPADISDLRFVNETKTMLTALGFDETRPIKANSVLFVCIGSTIGKVAQNVRDCATNQQINSVIPNDEHSGGFLYYTLSLNAERIANLAGRQAVPIINKTQFSAIKLPIPKLIEQERIANCLASLDDLITAQAQKLTTLKSHKQGLMQQLFPSMGKD